MDESTLGFLFFVLVALFGWLEVEVMKQKNGAALILMPLLFAALYSIGLVATFVFLVASVCYSLRLRNRGMKRSANWLSGLTIVAFIGWIVYCYLRESKD